MTPILLSFFSDHLLLGGLHFTVDGFRIVYALIAVWMWVLTSLFSFEYFKHEPEHLKRYAFFTLMTFLATEGVMFSADLMTTFFFFEILSMTSFVWVIHEQNAWAIRAAKTYFFIAVIGGLVLVMGLALLHMTIGTLRYNELHDAIAASDQTGTLYAAGICILLGFGAKAGMFPVHIWLPKSHPVAPSPASALLSGILTKVGIFGVLMTAVPGFLGNGTLALGFGLIVLLAGTITMALGALLALFSINLKRTLACSSMSQIGFILVGIGTLVMTSFLLSPELAATAAPLSEEAAHEMAHLATETLELAHNGLVLHMVNHSLIKLTLFMAAGVFVMNLHTLDLNDLRGYGRRKPLLMIPFALGALGISGIPFFNGYLSKTLLHEGLVVAREALEVVSFHSFVSSHTLAGALHVIEWIFLVSGGLTFAYMLKLFLCVFVEKHPEKQEKYDAMKPATNGLSTIVLLLSSLLMPLLGQPAVTGKLAEVMTGEYFFAHFHAFSWVNLKGGFTSLGIGAVVYLLVVRQVLMRKEKEDDTVKRYLNRWPANLDLEDLVYRPVLLTILPAIGGRFARFFAIQADRLVFFLMGSFLPTVGGAIARFFTVSLDGIVILMRHTILRERPRHTAEKVNSPGRLLRQRTATVAEPLLNNFSFSMMMVCLGLLVILGVILLVTLTR